MKIISVIRSMFKSAKTPNVHILHKSMMLSDFNNIAGALSYILYIKH